MATGDGIKLTDEARNAAASAWFDYLELLDPIRSDLFRYCRHLTGELFDAEDLVQDTLEQGFARLASVHHSIAHPRAYLLRIASNLWIDRIRRRSAEAASIAREASDPTRPAHGVPDEGDGLALRDAGAVLLRELAPRERAAVLLKEVFDLSLEETAEILGSTLGAVKSALHRGRGRLRDEIERAEDLSVERERDPAARNAPPLDPAVEAFVERYNARDLPGLLSLMLAGGEIKGYGHVYESGREAFERKGGWFHHNFNNPMDGSPSNAEWEIAEFRGQTVVLVLYPHEAERVVGSLMRIEARDGAIALIRVYALCPDVIAEVANELGRKASPVRFYRFPIRPGPMPT